MNSSSSAQESSRSPLLSVRNLSIEYSTSLSSGPIRAVDRVSFDLNEGEFLGLAGESGCGKSTLAYSLMRLLPTTARISSGEIILNGKNIISFSERKMQRMRGRDVALIFQQSMNAFNPVVNIHKQIVESILAHENVSKEKATQRARELFAQVGLDPRRLNSYPFEFSGGMKQRAMIAMALACRPKLLIADEPTTALDVTVQAQILDLMTGLRNRLRMSLIMITHDISVIASSCDRVAIMYAGKIVEQADVSTIFEKASHPYTKGLINAIPSVDKKSDRLVHIPGSPPNLRSPPSGCRFHPRCPYAKERCKVEEPLPREVGGSIVACHYAEEVVEIPSSELWSKEE